jgi:hypothetical protein
VHPDVLKTDFTVTFFQLPPPAGAQTFGATISPAAVENSDEIANAKIAPMNLMLDILLPIVIFHAGNSIRRVSYQCLMPVIIVFSISAQRCCLEAFYK